MNYTDTNSQLGSVEGQSVTTIPIEAEDAYVDSLVEHILKGPEASSLHDNFLYEEFQRSTSTASKITWFKKLLIRIQDMAQGLGRIPKWISASAKYRLEYAIDDEFDETILNSALPKRLVPKEIIQPVDALVASLKPKLAMPAPRLWKHMRESISAAIDAPTSQHPQVLIDTKDGKYLVFATVDQVLPNPDAFWSGESYSSGTNVKFEQIRWLDAAKVHETTTNLQRRIEELAPGIVDARSQLSETKKLVDEAEAELKIVGEDLGLIETELNADIHDADKVKSNHTHKLPHAITDPRKGSSKGSKSGPNSSKNSKKHKGKDESELTISVDVLPEKKKFWKSLFDWKGWGNK